MTTLDAGPVNPSTGTTLGPDTAPATGTAAGGGAAPGGGAASRNGAVEIVVDIEAPGRRRWNVEVSLGEGKTPARIEGLAMPFPMAPFEGIDVGADRRSPVSWALYERDGHFPFTGSLHWVRYEPGELAPDNGTRWLDFLKQQAASFD